MRRRRIFSYESFFLKLTGLCAALSASIRLAKHAAVPGGWLERAASPLKSELGNAIYEDCFISGTVQSSHLKPHNSRLFLDI